LKPSLNIHNKNHISIIRQDDIRLNYTENIIPNPNQNHNKNPNKIQSLFKLMRAKNIIPTILLCFTGGWIINPSFKNLLYSTTFLLSTLDTILIMSASMVINDIYDIEIDKINSPQRPLVSGDIKIYEAFLLSLFLIGSCEYITLNYLPDNLKLIIQSVIIQISIYTPILKRILFIKNLSCAALVSFSLFFSGLATSYTIMNLHKNFGLLSIAMSLIFFGSLSNEILLDIRDKEGDKNNNIVTIPTLFGNYFSWLCSITILYFSIISNTFSIAYLYTRTLALLIPLIISPLVINLYKIKKDNYSQESIKNYMKYSNYPLVLLLIYLCYIASFY
jgi:geranylgeranylglycerol-phosphate geranylgeranyltransferase